MTKGYGNYALFWCLLEVYNYARRTERSAMSGSENANNHQFSAPGGIERVRANKELLTTRRTKRLTCLTGGRVGKSKKCLYGVWMNWRGANVRLVKLCTRRYCSMFLNLTASNGPGATNCLLSFVFILTM